MLFAGSIIYIILFVLIDKSSVSINSLEREFSEYFQSENTGTITKSGVDTYKIIFQNSQSTDKNYDSTGFYLDGNKSYSPGFSLRIFDYYKDSLSLIKTQAKVTRLSTDSLNFIFVVTIETPGQNEPFWSASYSSDPDFIVKLPNIINGRIKTEGYPITKESTLKAYIWNIGPSPIRIESLEIAFGSDPAPSGDSTLIRQMEGEYNTTAAGYHPYLPKTKLSESDIQDLWLKEHSNINTIFNAEKNQLASIENNNTLLFKTKEQIRKINLPASTLENPYQIGINHLGELLISKRTIDHDDINYFYLNAKSVTEKRIVINQKNKWIFTSHSTLFAEQSSAWISFDGTRLVNTKAILFQCKYQNGISPGEIKSLTSLGSEQYLLFTNESTNNIFIGRRAGSIIEFTVLDYQNRSTNVLLSLSALDQWFPLKNNEYLILSRGWRYALYKIILEENSKITILNSYFPKTTIGGASPFYYERLSTTYIPSQKKLIFNAENYDAINERTLIKKYYGEFPIQ